MARFLSRDVRHKTPLGAVVEGATVRLAVLADDPVQAVIVHYAYGLETFSTSRKRLTPCGDGHWFETTIVMPDEACLFFYVFSLEGHGATRWLVRDGETGSARETTEAPPAPSGTRPFDLWFQQTVMSRAYEPASWVFGRVAYQIFPDRFCRGDDYNAEVMARRMNETPERIWHERWDEDVDIDGRPETGYQALDFYGGTLRGIQMSLDHLASLSVSLIYVNPIFRARSNHRYDTGDYETIDPLLGGEDDFRALVAAAQTQGMRLILDGVFSHTGADSRYFNREGRYPDVGAWQDARGEGFSPYWGWYHLTPQGDDVAYASWWGFRDLPNVNEDNLDYRAYILGPNGIVRRWLRAGAAGFRLDVSDELPDAFLRALRRAARAEKNDAYILGEVWQDASAQFSYGHHRDFLLGRTHDATMGYPLREAVIGWLTGAWTGQALCDRMATLADHAPTPCVYSTLTFLSTHDTVRAVTALGGPPDPGSRAACRTLRLTPYERERGERRLRLGYLLLVALPGVVSLYYGDEVALEGYKDPYNRRPMPWPDDGVWPPLLDDVRAILALRRWGVMRTGYWSMTEIDGATVRVRRWLDDAGRDVFGQEQDGPRQVTLVINRSDDVVSVLVPGDDTAHTVAPFGAAVWADGVCVPVVSSQV